MCKCSPAPIMACESESQALFTADFDGRVAHINGLSEVVSTDILLAYIYIYFCTYARFENNEQVVQF